MHLDKATKGYLADPEMKLSANTQKTYGWGLVRFQRFLETLDEVPHDTTELGTKDVIEFLRHLGGEGLSDASMGLYIQAVVGFYNWLIQEEAVDFSATDFSLLQSRIAKWRKNLDERKSPKQPTEEDVVATLALAQELDADDPRLHLLNLRNGAVMLTLASTGCRIGEVADLKRKDLIPDRRAARVTGKGNKSRNVFLSEEAWDAIHTYLTERDKILTVQGEEPLFARHDLVAHHGGLVLPIAPNGLRWNVKKLCQKAGVPYYTPHKLRHRRATEFLRQTDNLELTRKMLGHSSVSTTQIYAHLDDSDLEAAIRGEES